MILTFSGRDVGQHTGIPALVDIAIGLARMPRFGGQGRRWWSVADHSLFTADLAHKEAESRGLSPYVSRCLELAALMHDAHEAVTADVPTPFKGDDLRRVQADLDKRIFEAFLPRYMRSMVVDIVKELDHRALLAEACEYGPPALHRNLEQVERHFGAVPEPGDLQLLRRRRPSSPRCLEYPVIEEIPVAREFLWRYNALR